MTVLEALDALRANPTQWKCEYSRIYDGNGNLVAVFQSDELAGEAALAVNHQRRFVAAAEAEGCGTPRHRYVESRCLGCLALAALQRDIEAVA